MSGTASAKCSFTLAVNMNRLEAASDEENMPSILVHSMVSDDLGKLLAVKVRNLFIISMDFVHEIHFAGRC